MCTLAVVQNLTGQDPLGYKRKYSYCGDLFFIFINFVIFFLQFFWWDRDQIIKKKNHIENKYWCEK